MDVNTPRTLILFTNYGTLLLRVASDSKCDLSWATNLKTVKCTLCPVDVPLDGNQLVGEFRINESDVKKCQIAYVFCSEHCKNKLNTCNDKFFGTARDACIMAQLAYNNNLTG